MTATSVSLGLRQRSDTARTIVDTAAPGLLIAYMLLFFGPFSLLYQPPGSVSSVVFPAAALVILVLTPTDRLARIPISWALLALLTWLTLSRFWSETPFATEFQIRSQLPPLLMIVLVVGTMRPAVVARTLVITSVSLALWTLVISLILPAAREALLEVSASGTVESQPGLRGTFGHKNQMGIFMVFTLCLVLAFVRTKARPYLVILCVGLVIATQSATAGSGLFAVMFIWFWIAAIGQQRTARERTLLGLISITAAILAILFVVGLLPTILGLYQKDLTFSGRTLIWGEALEAVVDRPLHGYGFGGLWYDARSPVTADLWARIGFAASHAHNGPLELTLQAGLIGLGLYLSLIGSVVAMSVRSFGRPNHSRYGEWGILTVSAIFLMSVSEPLFTGPQTGLVAIIWTVLATLLHQARRQRFAAARASDDNGAEPDDPPRQPSPDGDVAGRRST